MLRVITPQESAETARKKLSEAAKALAEAQVAILAAMHTLEMFEDNFRKGWYIPKPIV